MKRLLAILVLAAACTSPGGGNSAFPIGPPSTMATWFDGDSITSGWQGVKPYPSYIQPSWNAAVGGSVIENLTNRVPQLFSQYGKPTRYYVMIGINDIFNQGEGVSKLVKDIQAFEAAIGFRPTYLTITPHATHSAVRNAWNDWLRANRTVVDCGDLWGDTLPASRRIDAVHLNELAHQEFALCVGGKINK